MTRIKADKHNVRRIVTTLLKSVFQPFTSESPQNPNKKVTTVRARTI